MPNSIGSDVTTKTRVSASVAYATLFVVGGAAMVIFGLTAGNTKKVIDTSSSTPVVLTSTSTTTPDLTTDEVPKAEFLNASGLAAASQQILVPPPDFISMSIVSPTEGSVVTGDTPITVNLTDPNHLVTGGIRLSIYSDTWPAYLGGKVTLGVDTQAPYTFTPNFGLYPSGEFLYLAEALKADGTVVTSKNTMVTWARTCYYLGQQDMTLDAPTSPVAAGHSITLTGSVTNKARGNCQHTYLLTTDSPIGHVSWLPAGWTATITPEIMNFGINEKKTFTMTINVPGTATAGSYQVGASSQMQGTGIINTAQTSVQVTRPTSSGGGGGPKVIPE